MKKHFFSLRERGLFLLLLGLFLSFSSYAQDITVKGVVKDSKFGDHKIEYFCYICLNLLSKVVCVSNCI